MTEPTSLWAATLGEHIGALECTRAAHLSSSRVTLDADRVTAVREWCSTHAVDPCLFALYTQYLVVRHYSCKPYIVGVSHATDETPTTRLLPMEYHESAVHLQTLWTQTILPLTPLTLDTAGISCNVRTLFTAAAGGECSRAWPSCDLRFVWRMTEDDGPWDVAVESWIEGAQCGWQERLESVLESLLAGRVPPSLLPDEKAQVVAWGNVATVTSCEDTSMPQTLHTAVEDQVHRTPDRTALVCPGYESVTYRELDTRATRLAIVLQRECAVGPEATVVLQLERTPALLVAMLAVLKAGGAYVPVLPSDPVERRRAVVRSCRPACVVTTGDGTTEYAGTACVPLPPDGRWTGLQDDTLLRVEAPPECSHPCYVLYTSGSSGTPKGVVLEHRNVATFVQECVRLRAGLYTRFLWMSAPTFDAHVACVYPTLSTGGCLYLYPMDQLLASLDQILVDERITAVDCTPTVWSLATATPDTVPHLRYLALGGEVVPLDMVRPWAQAEHVSVVNLYGPTETTVEVTMLCYQGTDLPHGSIGHPLSTVRAYVVDPLDHTRLLPPGVAGELAIGGPQVARGYVVPATGGTDRFRTTPSNGSRDVFRPDPFHPGRIYLTGDSVQWMPDGALRFFGRLDNQVKLLGVRIELGEIEQVLRHTTGYAVACVVSRTDRGESLVACVAAPGGDADVEWPTSRDERVLGWLHGCRAHLQASMVPSTFVVFARGLPVTSTGKVDCRALQHLVDTACHRPREPTPFVEPTTPAEAAMCELWQSITGSRVGVADTWDSLGGNSMQSLRLAYRAGCTVTDIEPATTVRSLCRHIQARRAETPGVPPSSFPVIDTSLTYVPRQVPRVSSLLARPVLRGLARCQTRLRSSKPPLGVLSWLRTFEPLSRTLERELVLHGDFAVVSNPSRMVGSGWTRVVEQLLLHQPVLRARCQSIGAGTLHIAPVDPADATWLGSRAANTLDMILLVDRPLFRIHSDGDSRVSFSAHHAIFDHFSEYILQQTVQAILDSTPTPPAHDGWPSIQRWYADHYKPLPADLVTLTPLDRWRTHWRLFRRTRSLSDSLEDVLAGVVEWARPGTTTGSVMVLTDLRTRCAHPSALGTIGFACAPLLATYVAGTRLGLTDSVVDLPVFSGLVLNVFSVQRERDVPQVDLSVYVQGYVPVGPVWLTVWVTPTVVYASGHPAYKTFTGFSTEAG